MDFRLGFGLWMEICNQISIDGHICWDTKRRWQFIVCRSSKTNFRFPISIYRKQTEVCRFRFPLALFFRIYIFIETTAYIDIHISIYIYIFISLFLYIYMLPFQTENRKRKPRRFSLILLPFAHRANGSLSFFFLTKKQTEVSVSKRTKRKKRTCPSMHIPDHFSNG